MFRESELITLSDKDYQLLVTAQLLVETYQDPEDTFYYDKNKTAYRVRKRGADYIGYRIRGEGDATILLDKSDIKFYRFDFIEFSRILKDINGLTGKFSQITSRLHFVGKKELCDGTLGFLIGFFDSDRTAEEELMSLPTRLKQYSRILVACPNFEISEDLNSRLISNGLFCKTFDTLFDDSWMINFDIVPMKKSDEQIDSSIPYLTDTEKKKYAKDYPRRDVIELFGSAKGYIIKVNGHEMELDRVPYGLLLFLAKALKADEGGKISINDAVNENIVRDKQHFYRVAGELNKLMKPFLEDKNDKIVDKVRDEKGTYRLTTMPTRIRQPHTKWINSRYKIVKGLIEKERQKRGVELNYPI
jgi:hypothetical protein